MCKDEKAVFLTPHCLIKGRFAPITLRSAKMTRHLVETTLFLIAALLVAAGYTFGARRAQSHENALKATLEEQAEKLTLVEHELLRRSNLDPVTQLATHQSLQEFLEREWRRAARDNSPVSLIMIEVDHFRAFNDRMGKPEGDACLKHVADELKKVVNRPADLLARYGAGRFGVALGGTDSKGAMVLAEKLRAAVDALRLPNPASTTGPNITLSLGVASVMPKREAAWQDIELIATAEQGLAQAREAGRNRVGFEPMTAL
jgi:two-component system, chemotaxis family, response regulator WspR